jgi:hypothetical protein
MTTSSWNAPPLNAQISYVKGIYPPETARRIVQGAVEAVRKPEVADLARRIVRGIVDENASPFFAVLSEIQAVYNIAAVKMRYTRDPHGVELVYGAEYIVKQWNQGQKWAEDCDTYASLLMAFFLAIGRHARVTIVSFTPDEPQRFEHVFVEVFLPPDPERMIPSRWVVVDPSTGPSVRKMISQIKHAQHFYPE